MKKKLLLALLAFFAINGTFCQIDTVAIDLLKSVANKNAQSLWGDVYPSQLIPYYSSNDKIIAYRINYSIGKPFALNEDYFSFSRNFAQQGIKAKQWGKGEFGQMLIGATFDLPPFITFSNCLSFEYVNGYKVEEFAHSELGSDYYLARIYYFNQEDQWFCYTNGNQNKFINFWPVIKVLNEGDFNKLKNEKVFFCSKGYFKNIWDEYEKNTKVLDVKDPPTIPSPEYCPYLDWSYGCTPTAAAMVLAYWDNYSEWAPAVYSNLVDFYFQRIDHVENEMDFQVANLQEQLAEAMETSINGWTTVSKRGPGIIKVCNDDEYENNYNFDTECIWITGGMQQAWTEITTEISTHHRPLIVGQQLHDNCGIGYIPASNHIIVHNTHNNTKANIHVNTVTDIEKIIPDDGYGCHIKLIQPIGDQGYNSNGNGEKLTMGINYNISWYCPATNPDPYFKLFYSADGGLSWVLIDDNIPYTGNNMAYTYDFAGIMSSMMRIKVELWEDNLISDDLLGSDASFGNFTVGLPGSWIGVKDDDWDDQDNWFDNTIPNQSKDVMIPADVTYMPNITGTAITQNLTVYLNASLTISETGNLTTHGSFINDGNFLIETNVDGKSGSFINNGSLGGSGTFQFNRYLGSGDPGTHFGWHYVSSPVNNTVSGDFVGYWVKEYLPQGYNPNPGVTHNFKDIDPCIGCCSNPSQFNISLQRMKGYSVKLDKSYTCSCESTGELIEFGGDHQDISNCSAPTWCVPLNLATQKAYMTNINTGNITLGISGEGTKYNLVGNPYPSGWDFNTFKTGPNWPTGLNNAIYFWDEDADQYASYVNGVSTNGGTNFVPPTQAFFLEADGTVPNINLTFTNAERTHAGVNTYFKQSGDILKLKASGDYYSDESVIRILSDAKASWDGTYDAKKLFSLGETVPALFTKAGELNLSINSLPENNSVPLYFTSLTGGNYSMEAIENDFDQVYIEDKLNGNLHDLSSPYTFYHDPDNDEGRFVIHFNGISTESGEKGFVIYSNQNNVYVYSVDGELGEISIYNIVGQYLTSVGLKEGLNILVLNDASGYYIVKVQTDQNVITKKVYIH